MDGIFAAHNQQESKANLAKSINSVQSLIDLLQQTRDGLAASASAANADDNGDNVAGLACLNRLQQPIKQCFGKIEEDLKDVNRGMNVYQKALKDKFKSAALPTSSNRVLVEKPELVNRAVAMHLLREGKFDVARTFVREVGEHPPKRSAEEQDGQEDGQDKMQDVRDDAGNWDWMKELSEVNESMLVGIEAATSNNKIERPDEAMLVSIEAAAGRQIERSGLQKKFTEMYHILDALRNQHNLEPAIEWARHHASELEHRGSNLEFELARLKFVELYTTEDIMSDESFAGPLRALDYARQTFPFFSNRYARETSSLLGSLAYSPELSTSPYNPFFHNTTAFEDVSTSFTREFCGMLGLSSQSPLYTAVTAGGIALPVLEKVERVMAQARGQWTSVNELPVETPLPPGFLFHSIFVCPVSKEQATDDNPPMMLPCGHVIAKESLEMHSRGKNRMKCPYCPIEAHPRDARRVYI